MPDLNSKPANRDSAKALKLTLDRDDQLRDNRENLSSTVGE